MTISIGTGATFSIASAYGTASNITAITNAAEAVATFSAGHGFVVGDILEITSGWGLLNGRLARVKTVATNDITLETIDTTNVSKYPAGSGTGTGRKVSTWQQLSQVQTPAFNGGDQQYVDVSTMDDLIDKQAPTSRSALALKLTVFDDPSLAYYSTLTSAQNTLTPVGLRVVSPTGPKLYGNAYWTIAPTPVYARNQPVTLSVDLTFSAPITRYVS